MRLDDDGQTKRLAWRIAWRSSASGMSAPREISALAVFACHRKRNDRDRGRAKPLGGGERLPGRGGAKGMSRRYDGR